MPSIQFESPRSVDAALQLLRESESDGTILSGGTNVIVNLRERHIHPRLLVDVSRIPAWNRIVRSGDVTRLGPNCTMTDLLINPVLTDGAQLLPMTAAWFAGPSIRNRATVAGNAADASPAADITVPLLALNAQIEITDSRNAPRQVPLQDFVLGPRKTILAPDALITAVTLENTPGAEVAYYKLARRNSLAISIVSVAILIKYVSGRCSEARIALGAVAPVPFRARRAEEALLGQPLDSKTAIEAGKLARAQAAPISDVRGTAQYRSEMIEHLVVRLLEEIAGRREGG